MKSLKKKNKIILMALVLSILIIGLLQKTIISHAQPQYNQNDETLNVSYNFPMLEFSDQIGTNDGISSINITLPSSDWNITDIDLNFTEIKLGKETKTIEEGGSSTSYVKVDQGDQGWGVQISITETPTIIFGVYIYGYMELADDILPTEEVFVQIHGYENGVKNIPNGTILRNMSINMGIIPGWYLQEFSQSISLSAGQYYLVINGTNLINDETIYHWRKSDPSTEPGLHISRYKEQTNKWEDGIIDIAFWYKLIQRVNRSYYPQEIEMSVEVDSIKYNVTDGLSPYSGNVTIPNLINFYPGIENLYLPIDNNESVELFFNLSYSIKLKNLFQTDGSVSIRKILPNKWTIEPNITRTNGNYSIEFEHPESWYNLTFFRDKQGGAGWENVTEKVTLINNFIFIPNNTITEGALWKITANSPNVEFSWSIPTTIYGPSQTISITVDPPAVIGNLTFLLINPYGAEDFRDEIENPSAPEIISHTLSINPFSGNWQALIYWNNNTDAGLQSISLQINIATGGGGSGGDGDSTIITGLDPQLVFMVVLTIILVSLAGLTTYQLAKRHKKVKAEHRQKIFNKYMDVLNLNYIIIIDKNSGLNVYEQILAGKDMDVTLITGFLEAIRTFGIELTGAGEESQAISLNYHNMNIIMNDFKNFRIISIMKESPSKDFLEALKPLSRDIDTFYGKSLKNFDGEVSKFKGIKDLLDDHLQISLIYPLKIVESKDVKLDISERTLVNKASAIMKKRNINHFYVSYLISGKEFNVRNAERILKLINKKVFQPLN